MILAKVTQRGVVWTSKYIGYNNLAYQMERAGSRKNDYQVIEEIQVQRAEDGKGWNILLFGDVVGNEHYKSDAQRAAEDMLDNPKDKFGWVEPV
jgi:hypothetical protein